MEYHDVLPNISLSRMSVGALDLAWKKSTLGKLKYQNIKNSDLDGMSLASFCQSRAALLSL